MKNQNLAGHLLALVTVFIWGVTFISTKILLRELLPVEILFYRFVIAYIVLFLIYPKIQKSINIREELLFLSLGVTGVSFYFLFENIALQFSLASNVSLLISAAPILTAIIAHFTVRDEKMSRGLIGGFLVAIVGIFLVVFNGKLVLKLNPIGDMLAIFAALLWAVYSVLLKKIDPDWHPVYVVRKTFFYGLLTTVPWLFWFKADLRVSHHLGLPIVFNIFFLGLIASALCYVMWNQSVKRIGVVRSGNYIYLVPLVTMITSDFILGEKVNGFMILGGMLIFSGVYITERGFGIGKISKEYHSARKIPVRSK
ncbi:MAG TPA: EamA family transporter [Firmicutes bacterium]|jgi:drug/metabolite transporter (DMT)-like permease|nr:EamA family transporter [Bacillota bacterium]